MGLRFVFMPSHLLLPGWARISATLRGACAPYPDCGPYGSHVPGFLPGAACWLGLLLLLTMHTVWLSQLVRKGLRQVTHRGGRYREM